MEDSSRWSERAILLNSGTSALGIAVKTMARLAGVGSQFTVALPAYGCPNLVAAVRWAGGVPDYYDVEYGDVFPNELTLQQQLSLPARIVVGVDAFGAGLQYSGRRDESSRLILDCAQSYQPFDEDWKSQSRFTVVSFGRAKPVSLTVGGAILIHDDAGRSGRAILEQAISHLAESDQTAWRLKLQMHAYRAVLNPVLFGLATRIPALGIGRTELKALHLVRRMPSWFYNYVDGAVAQFRATRGRLMKATQEMVSLSQSAGALIPIKSKQLSHPLWRLPLLCKSESHAETLARRAAHLGVTRMYRKTLPEFDFTSKEEVRERWPHAADLASRLVTVPTHGRLHARDRSNLRKLIQEFGQ